MIDIRAMPIYLDGSDGSIWASRDTWEDIFTVPGLKEKRYIRISDLLLWLETNNYPVMDLTELLRLSILHATKSKEAANASASLLDKTGLSLVPTGQLESSSPISQPPVGP